MTNVAMVDLGTGEIVDDGQQYLSGDSDAIAIGRAYRMAATSIVESVKWQVECGERLAQKKKALNHGEWLPWLKEQADVLGFSSDRTAQRLIKIANATSTSDLTPPEALKISRQTWGNAANHLAQGTGENEWYTPTHVIEFVRRVLGDIDLDPASNPEANETVQAARYYTAADNGLTQKWYGRVWLNPPYSRDLMPQFVAKLIAEYQSGNVSAAILVSHNNTDTNWFQSLASVSSAICFPSTRIKFYRGDDVAAPVNGQAFFYLGQDLHTFSGVFGDMGVVLRVVA